MAKTQGAMNIEMLMKRMVNVKTIARELAQTDVLEHEDANKFEVFLDAAFNVLEQAYGKEMRPVHVDPEVVEYKDHVIVRLVPEGYWEVHESAEDLGSPLFVNGDIDACKAAIDEVAEEMSS